MHLDKSRKACATSGEQKHFFLPKKLTAVFRKTDPGNNLILGLKSDPKSKRARFKFTLTKDI